MPPPARPGGGLRCSGWPSRSRAPRSACPGRWTSRSTGSRPRTGGGRRRARGANSEPSGPKGGMDTLLVLEDDVATRTFLADNLTADGYDLLVAETASD